MKSLEVLDKKEVKILLKETSETLVDENAKSCSYKLTNFKIKDCKYDVKIKISVKKSK